MPTPQMWHRLRALLWRQDVEGRLDDELRFHIDRQTEKNRRAGLPHDEARRQALLRLGGLEQVRERTRDEFRAAAVENTVRDVRFGLRALMRAPAFVIVAVLTLGLGIGATTAMFSVVNGVLLRPLPYPAQDRLVETAAYAPSSGTSASSASPAMYFGYRDHNRTFDAIGHWDWDSSPVTITGAGEPESVASLEMTYEVLAILGATPVLGRNFDAGDDTPGAAPTVIISHGYWQRRFGGTNPVGRTLIVEGVSREIIGVLPRTFRFFDYDADVFYPQQFVRAEARYPSGDGRAIARLKQGVTLDQANADVARMVPLLWEEFNRTAQRRELRATPMVRPLKDAVVGDLRETLWLLMGTIGLLLVIACANVANLMLVRSQSRRPELVLRSALGAGWVAIARVVLTESALLGVAGALVGVGVAYVSLPLVLWLAADELPQVMHVRVDALSVLVAALVAALATMLFSVVPVVQLAFRAPRQADALQGGRSVGEERGVSRIRQALLVGQVAIALILLVGSGLMIRTFTQLRRVDPGVGHPETAQTFRLTVPRLDPLAGEAGAANRARLLQTQRAILERLSAVGGVTAVGFSSGNDGLPLDGDGRQIALIPYVDGRPSPDGVVRTWEIQQVSPGYYEALQTPIVAGRGLTWDDVENQRRVMLMSDGLARREFGSRTAALGRRISAFGNDPGDEIVGVVADVHHDGLHQPAPDTVVYGPRAVPTASFVVRSSRAGDAAFLRDLQQAIWLAHPELSMAGVQTMGDLHRRAMARATMTLLLLGLTGTLAFVLGLIGTYGVVDYAVTQRRREIGLRLALGASRRTVVGMFVRQALALVAIGVVIGLAAAAGLTRVIASQLYGVGPLDLATHATMAFGLLAAGALASVVSARRGAMVDPASTLKGE